MQYSHDCAPPSATGPRRAAAQWVPADAGEADAIIILAGGLTAEGGLPPWVVNRLDRAAELHASQGGRGYVVCSGGGTPHKPPPLSETGYVRWESLICAEYLVEKCGVAPDRILKEWSSHDTVGNAYYVAAQHAVPRRWRNVTVVTSEFHMPRSRVLHEWVYGLEGMCAPDAQVALTYEATPDAGLAEDVLEARREREAASTADAAEKARRYTTLEAYHEWLHTDHDLYATARQDRWNQPPPMSDKALASY